MSLKPPVTEHDHIAGVVGAPLTLVEYGDYQCPHCAAADPHVRAVQKELGAKLRFVFRNFPLTELHPAAEAAAELAESAASQHKFWETHDAIFAWSRQNGPESLGAEAFEAIARGVGLDADAVAEAVANHRYLERIKADFNSGVRSGVNGTPTFFINGARFDGAPVATAISQALHEALRPRP